MWLVLVMGFLACAVIALALVAGGIVLGVRRGRHSWAGLLGAVASAAFGVGLGLYAWGLGCLSLPVMDADSGGTDSAPPQPCREAGMDKAMHVRDYAVGLLPLRFECKLDGGGSYTVSSAVPGYANRGAAVFTLVGLTAAIGSAAVRGRKDPMVLKGA
ncbi:hypothetical protein J4573_27370 [Actinomadura barringtoniae]|uniref:Uncharacterized protein n=1 Tax=Actinomadura barringtoniae TaxID=1427535 RepID=A0A939T5N6_9ACTN|nr:hypothetical protein [Actinomadura barringtoniae]MBO2450848.1 hypothetical protein [Actinomadura barringtoniae]